MALISKRWCFTINNYTGKDCEDVNGWPFLYLVYGKEVGRSGTPHLQGFVTFKSKKRLSGVKKLHGTAHWEVTQGTSQQAADYCKKEGDYVEFGSTPYPGRRSDLDDVAKLLKAGSKLSDVADAHPAMFITHSRGIREYALLLQEQYEHDDVRGVWIYGAPGVGKSRYARKEWPEAYAKQQNKWFDGYDGEEAIILDDLDKGGVCLSHHLKIWCDRYSCKGETKGGMVNLRHKAFVVTSNYSIDDLWPSFEDDVLNKAIKRRFKVIHMDPLNVGYLD